MAHPFIIFAAIWLGLCVPGMIGETSLRRFGLTLLVSGVGVILPLFVFFFSAFLVPEWKGGCKHGWFDCFQLGKLALTPLVLWATGALYAVEVCRVEPPFRRGLVLGLFSGVTVAGGCFVYGVISVGIQLNVMVLWLLVPLYVSVWHAIRLVQVVKHSDAGPASFGLTFIGSLPFWIGGAVWSRNVFEALPNNPPSCFVVTAATRGHRNFVGPFVEIPRHGHVRSVNQQLLTLWQLEAMWRANAPWSHAAFRRVYNFIGPIIARRIRSPWVADMAYVALKPAEWLARLIIRRGLRTGSSAKTSRFSTDLQLAR